MYVEVRSNNQSPEIWLLRMRRIPLRLEGELDFLSMTVKCMISESGSRLFSGANLVLPILNFDPVQQLKRLTSFVAASDLHFPRATPVSQLLPRIILLQN